MSEKIFRKDLLIENIRKTLYQDDDSCYWCPIRNNCTGGELLCSEERAEDFSQIVIAKFSTEVEVI